MNNVLTRFKTSNDYMLTCVSKQPSSNIVYLNKNMCVSDQSTYIKFFIFILHVHMMNFSILFSVHNLLKSWSWLSHNHRGNFYLKIYVHYQGWLHTSMVVILSSNEFRDGEKTRHTRYQLGCPKRTWRLLA